MEVVVVEVAVVAQVDLIWSVMSVVNLVILPENVDCVGGLEDVVAAVHLGSAEAQAMGEGEVTLWDIPFITLHVPSMELFVIN